MKNLFIGLAIAGLVWLVFFRSIPTEYIAYPTDRVMAVEHNGVCTAHPTNIPQRAHIVWVSPKWTPCQGVK